MSVFYKNIAQQSMYLMGTYNFYLRNVFYDTSDERRRKASLLTGESGLGNLQKVSGASSRSKHR
jgi:putative heme iron utilization protein